MTRKVAAAVRLTDGLTGEPVFNPSVRLRMRDGAQPVRKAGGYYVFWDNGERWRTLEIESELYEDEQIEMDIEELKQKRQPVVRICLMPSASYPFPSGLRWKEGTAEPFQIVEAVLEGSEEAVRLTEDYMREGAGGRFICLTCAREIDPAGLRLEIGSGSGSEICEIWECVDQEKGIYLLKEPLGRDYACGETKLLLRFRTRADEHGNYRVPVPALDSERGKG